MSYASLQPDAHCGATGVEGASTCGECKHRQEGVLDSGFSTEPTAPGGGGGAAAAARTPIWVQSEALPGAEDASALNDDICQRLHWSALAGQALVSAGQLSVLPSAGWGLHPPALGRGALASTA